VLYARFFYGLHVTIKTPLSFSAEGGSRKEEREKRAFYSVGDLLAGNTL